MSRLPALSAAAVATVAVLIIPGCGRAAPGPGSAPVSRPVPSTGPASAGPPGTGTALAAVTVECQGGVAGVQERLDVRPDGTVTGTQARRPGTRSTPLRPDERSALAGALARAAASTYRPTYRTDQHAGDLFEYRIRIGAVTVAADDLTIPRPLADVVAALAPARARVGLTC